MPTINIIATDGATVAQSTTISEAQASQFIFLAQAIEQAREMIRQTEGQVNIGHKADDPDAEFHPLTVRALLPRLDEILGGPSASLRKSISETGDYLSEARDLGMLLTNENQPYDRAELSGGPRPCRLNWR